MNKKIGKITTNIIKILELEYKNEMPIFIGEDNIKHIKEKHPNDFIKYGTKIKNIIKHPTYLARNKKKHSIEFIKEYKVDNEYVLVAVRVSMNNVHFARTMYIMSDEKVKKYFENNYFYKFKA